MGKKFDGQFHQLNLEIVNEEKITKNPVERVDGVSMYDILKALGHTEVGVTGRVYTHMFDKKSAYNQYGSRCFSEAKGIVLINRIYPEPIFMQTPFFGKKDGVLHVKVDILESF